MSSCVPAVLLWEERCSCVLLCPQQDDIPEGGRAAQRHALHPHRARHHDQPRPHEVCGLLLRGHRAHEDHQRLHPKPVHGAHQVQLPGEVFPAVGMSLSVAVQEGWMVSLGNTETFGETALSSFPENSQGC